MPSPAWEDPAEFIDEDDFASPAVITLQGGGRISLSVIFDDPDVDAGVGDAYTRDDTMPRATCDESLVDRVKRGDTIAITFPRGQKRFDILEAPKPDGTGMAVLKLSRP